jgi:polyisoprenoid-binding protein YceI
MLTRRRRRLLGFVGAAIVLVVVVALAGPYIYIHFIEGPAPARLELPRPGGTTSTSAQGSISSPRSVSGTWRVGAGSVAGYRVRETLLGQSSTAVGRTSNIWGSLTISDSTVTGGTFTANMASVMSDQSERNARFTGPIMDVSHYPTAKLTLSSPINLRVIPADGVIENYHATGSLDMHGVTSTVTFTVSAVRLSGEIDALADITVPFADWNISNPSIGGFVTTANSGTLEVLLRMTQAAGNPASTSSGSSGAAGGGGPVTVPSTTVPPLTVPTG